MQEKSTDRTPASGAERQRTYHKRMRDAGFARLSVWVPLTRKADFDDAVIRLQKKWEREGLYPDQKETAS